MNDRVRKPAASLLTLILAAFIAIPLAGCGSDSNGTTPLSPAPSSGSSQFTGTLTDGAQSGKLTVTVASETLAPALHSSRATIAATARIQWGVGTPDAYLYGTYDAQTDSIDIAGDGYSVRGFHSTVGGVEGITGEFDGPGGHGGFAICFGPESAVTVFCGTFTSTSGGGGGSWNLAARDSVFLGIAVTESGGKVPFYGTAKISAFQERRMDIWTFRPDVGAVSIGTGTWDTAADSMWGTYSLDDGNGGSNDGTWKGQICLAEPPPPPQPPPFPLPAAFTGILLGGTSAFAKLSLTIEPQITLLASRAPSSVANVMPDTLPVTGTFQFGGEPVVGVSGSLNLRTHAVHASSANDGLSTFYEISGYLYKQGGSGDWTMAGDLSVEGTQNGGFGCFLGGPDVVTSYCGTYASSTTNRAGDMEFILSGPSVMLFGDVFGVSQGTATGDGATKALTFTGHFGSYPFIYPTNGAGTLNTDTHEATGTWEIPVTNLPQLDFPDAGTWTANLCP